jgi:rod shape determining protein RodA
MLEHFPWTLLLSMLGLIFCGLTNLYSISGGETSDWNVFTRQGLICGLGLGVMLLAPLIDYRGFRRLAWPLYGLGLLFLALVDSFGVSVNNATRWLQLTSTLRFQPSEFMKFALVMVLACWFSRQKDKGRAEALGFKDLLVPAALVLPPCWIVAKQPDVGTALHLFLIAVPMLLFQQLKRRIVVVMIAALLTVPGWLFLFDGLQWLEAKEIIKPYHLQRYNTFLNPEKDPNGKGWQITQSKSAIGSGQILGRGFMEGSQQKYGFLPAAETDFAFAALAEEWGFVGALALLALFLSLCWAALGVVRRSAEMFGTMLALGLTSMLFWQAAINVAMVTGLFPVVGIPLPFISYGGTSTLVAMVGVGLVLNVGMRRYVYGDDPVTENPKVWRNGLLVPAVAPELQVRRLKPYDPLEPELHPAHRLPHCRPWAKHLTDKWLREFHAPE